MKFNKADWYIFGQWVQPPISGCFWDHWIDNNRVPFNMDKLDGRFPIIHGYSMISKKDKDIITEFALSNKGNFKIIEEMDKWVDKAKQEAQKVKTPLGTMPETLKQFKGLFHEVVSAWVFPFVYDDDLTKDLKKICKEKGYDFDKIAGSIRPSKDVFITQMNKEARKLYKEIEEKKLGHEMEKIEGEDADLAKEIKEHVDRFCFVGVHHFLGEPYTIEKFFENFNLKPNTDDQEEKVEIPEDIKWHAKMLSHATYQRTVMAETSGFLSYYIKPTLLKANEELGLNKDEYIWLTLTEIINGLENPDGFKKPNIEARKEKNGIYSIDDKEIVVTGKDVDAILDQLVEKPKDVVWPLKGSVACKGKAVGFAKIIISPDDIYKMKKGDILIAPETTPEFFAGMRIAAAIVTGRGGITSHAAIVSRELGVPCIVGVKDVPYIIKDGQKIEVDAEKGEVRLVE